MYGPTSKILFLLLLAATTLPSGNASQGAEIDDSIGRLVNYRREHRSAPTLDFYFSELEKTNLSNPDQARLYLELVKLQEPQLSLENLIALLATTRDSIRTFSCEYKYTTDPTDSIHAYTFGPGHVLIEEPNTAAEGRFATSFDGELERHVMRAPGKMTNARIDRLHSLTTHHRPYMPLCQAMMFSSDRIANLSTAPDLPKFLEAGSFQVFEQTEQIDGSECLVVANFGFQFYLDIEKNFAIRRLDSFDFEYGDATAEGVKAIKRRILSDRRIHSDFKDYGNGIWLPSRMELYHYLRGSGPKEEITTVLSMAVNPTLEDSTFTDIIPDDAFVADGVQGLAYVQSDSPSIEKLILDQVPSKSSRATLVIWLNVAAFSILIFIFILRRTLGSKRAPRGP